MESLTLSLQVVGPLFLLMAVGFFLRRIDMLDGQTTARMSTVTFRIFLSTQTFSNIYSCNLAQVWDGREVLINIFLMALNFIIALAAAAFLQKDKKRKASLVQGMFQNSYITFGVPMVSAAYGSGSTGMVSMMTALIVPLKNLIIVADMSAACSKKKSAVDLALNVLKNPFFLGGALGFAVNLLGIKLPVIVEQTVSNLAKAATPMALLLLGASLSFKSMKDYKKDIIWGVLIKMLLMPAALLPLAVAFGLRGSSLMSTLIMLAAPPATSAHIIAKEMGADRELASQLTVSGSAISSLTLFLLIVVLKYLNYL